VLAVSRGGARRLYTRRGEDVGARFPELLEALSFEGAIEGMVVAPSAEGRPSRIALEARLARPRAARAGNVPSRLLAYDLLDLAGEDLRGLALRERRARLEALAPATDRIAVTALLAAADWAALDALRMRAREGGAAGIVLKSWTASYPAEWLELRCDPLTAQLVLLYVERAAAGAPTATLGAWRGGELVPVAKADLADPELAARVVDYVRERRVDRFGPVEQVRAEAAEALVVAAAFAGVEPAPRRKAGLLLREARIVAVLEAAEPAEAARLEELEALLS
jgi:DNA ligase-1